MKHGISKWYDQDGKQIAEYNYYNGAMVGVQCFFAKDNIISETNYLKDKMNGFFREYYENGRLKTSGSFVNDLKNGEWKEYSEDGKLKSKEKYENGIKK